MGRKIPGRKHKGVKDPLVQKAVREEKLKTKINAPPSNPDDQEIPKSLENIIRLKKLACDEKFLHKKRKRVRSKLIDTSRLVRKEFKLPGMKKPDKPLPNLVQWVGETEETFLKRIDEATQSLINEVEFEQQFGVHVKRNSDTGDIEGVETAVPDEIDALIKSKRLNEKGKNKRKKAKNKDVTSGESFMNSKQRKKQKALERKRLLNADNDEKTRLVDNIKFGEVVHRPPVLTTRPKNASQINRPGVKGNLLLHKMLNKNDSSRDKKFKLSNMSPLARQKHEEQRNNVVELYRRIKAQNMKKSR